MGPFAWLIQVGVYCRDILITVMPIREHVQTLVAGNMMLKRQLKMNWEKLSIKTNLKHVVNLVMFHQPWVKGRQRIKFSFCAKKNALMRR